MTTQEMLVELSKLCCPMCRGKRFWIEGEPCHEETHPCPDCQVDNQPTGLHPVALALTAPCPCHHLTGHTGEDCGCTCHGTGRRLKDVHPMDVLEAALHDSSQTAKAVLDAMAKVKPKGRSVDQYLGPAVAALYAAMETHHA